MPAFLRTTLPLAALALAACMPDSKLAAFNFVLAAA